MNGAHKEAEEIPALEVMFERYFRETQEVIKHSTVKPEISQAHLERLRKDKSNMKNAEKSVRAARFSKFFILIYEYILLASCYEFN